MNRVQWTMLSSMADNDFIRSLDRQLGWDIRVLDLKDCVFGKAISELTNAEAEKAFAEIERRNLSVYCFSTILFHQDIEAGEEEFKKNHLAKIERVLKIAKILKPKVIRLLAATSKVRESHRNIIPHILKETPWLLPLYREATQKISAAGFQATIENEAHRCIFSNPVEIEEFFRHLDAEVFFTYDVQNLWQMGTFPSLETYRALAPHIGYFHVKGGESGGKSDALAYSSSLEEASWPVLEITKAVVADGVSPIICLNPSHGAKKEGRSYDNIYERDLFFLRKNIQEIA